MSETAERLSYLEDTLARVAYSQLQANISIEKLSREMREFKDEMREFKDEMREFKDEMRGFKNEMREYKNWSKQQIITMNRQWGDLANKLGTVVEDMVAPNIPRIAKTYFGCPDLDYIAVRVKKKSSKNKAKRKEFDVIAVCEGIFILNETKSSPETRDIDQFAQFVQSNQLFDYFPEYEGFRICPIFSSLYLDDSLVTYLTRKGIYALTLKDDTMDIVNFAACSQ
ncbi:MAG TPA: hypothetical protein VJ943_05745 [Desulfotignum sp.]|nr:hypothetical protein [Desulfotignum sp.]